VIGFIRDAKGTLRAVLADWGAGGWLVEANSVENPDWWAAGARVVSR
jgi:hypothetical protein